MSGYYSIKKAIHLLLLSVIFIAFDIPNGVPNAGVVGLTSTVSGLTYFTDSTLNVEPYFGINESQIAKRHYKLENLYDFSGWNLEELFPNRHREITNQYYKYIPGAIWIERNFFVDETEIANLHWQEFTLEYPNELPTHQNNILPAGYYTNPKYRYYPVTGISHEQAERFCKWRTLKVTTLYNQKKGYKINDPEYTIFRFRLPTIAEWEKCAGYGLDLKKYPHGLKELKSNLRFTKKAAEYLAEMTNPILSEEELEKKLEVFKNKNEQDLIINCQRQDHKFLNLRTPFSIWSFPKNHFGIYNMLGNVAELVQEKDIVKGGSWLDSLDGCRILNVKEQKMSADDVGFRAVCFLEWPNQDDL